MPNNPGKSSTRRDGFQLRTISEESQPIAEDYSKGEILTTADYAQLGDLPHGYGDDMIFLVAQEPHWLFTYWDIDISRHRGGPTILRYALESGEIEGEIEVPFETRNWYIPVRHAVCAYVVEIGSYRAGEWQPLARSIPVETPPEGLSESEDFRFATVPFHLSFQRLIDNLEITARTGGGLIDVVAGMQSGGDFSAFGSVGFTTLLNDQQRAILAALLGPDLLEQLSSGGLSSAEMEILIRTYLEEQLSSGGASEALVMRFHEIAGSGQLFSGGAFSLSSESLASWTATEISSWAIGAVTSWNAGPVTSWTGDTSWTGGASGGSSWSQETLTSWLQGAETSGFAATLSSWLQGATSSWAQFPTTSWLQGMQSSWAGAALSSWSEGALSSWSAAAVTSWGGSETVSSFGLPKPREFRMHVNAEVIFYGGTDPDAHVTIDGKPIVLGPDGTFHYHFVFPNEDYEIPIVAESPDGVEVRRAVLRFSRETLKTGDVRDTAQPDLGSPMGHRSA